MQRTRARRFSPSVFAIGQSSATDAPPNLSPQETFFNVRAWPAQSSWQLRRFGEAAVFYSKHRGHPLQSPHAEPSQQQLQRRFERVSSLGGFWSYRPSCEEPIGPLPT